MLIVTFEFDRWLAGVRSSSRVHDRLDVLGLDSSGTLVVAELKRDVASDTTELQAIKYAAIAAQFTPSTLAQAHQRHLASQGEQLSVDEVAERLADHAGASLDLKILRRPRIVLIAGEYPDTTMTSAIWLTQMGVDFTLVRYQAYRTPVGIHVTTSRLWPLEQAEDLVVRPEERDEVKPPRNSAAAPAPWSHASSTPVCSTTASCSRWPPTRRCRPTSANRSRRGSPKHHVSAICHLAPQLGARLAACWRNGERYIIRDTHGRAISQAEGRALVAAHWTVPDQVRRANRRHRKSQRYKQQARTDQRDQKSTNAAADTSPPAPEHDTYRSQEAA